MHILYHQLTPSLLSLSFLLETPHGRELSLISFYSNPFFKKMIKITHRRLRQNRHRLLRFWWLRRHRTVVFSPPGLKVLQVVGALCSVRECCLYQALKKQLKSFANNLGLKLNEPGNKKVWKRSDGDIKAGFKFYEQSKYKMKKGR